MLPPPTPTHTLAQEQLEKKAEGVEQECLALRRAGEEKEARIAELQADLRAMRKACDMEVGGVRGCATRRSMCCVPCVLWRWVCHRQGLRCGGGWSVWGGRLLPALQGLQFCVARWVEARCLLPALQSCEGRWGEAWCKPAAVFPLNLFYMWVPLAICDPH